MVATANAGMTIHFKLDCRTGVREPAAEGEELRYDANWYDGCSDIRIKENGTVIVTGTAGVYTWHVGASDSFRLLTLEVLSEGQVVGTETAQFGFGYIRNVKARQLWPHNKVALEFTVADDVGEVKGADEDLFIWCARDWITNVATRIFGDRSAKPGVHRVVWDMEAEGLGFANGEVTFGVSVEEVLMSMGGVQLWENGPYWAECNVGASKPEEYGYYFWWGDTVGCKRNADDGGWVSVKDGTVFSFSSTNCPTYAKSIPQLQSAGYVDSTGKLVAKNDAATAHLGAPWRMPTDAELSALINNCDTQWTTRGGVYGRLVTGRGAYASKSIFLPAAGIGDDSYLYGPGSYGDYSSSTPASDDSWYAYYDALSLFFKSNYYRRDYSGREGGRSVRPLRGFAQ